MNTLSPAPWIWPTAVATIMFCAFALAAGHTDHFRFCDLIRIGHFVRAPDLAPCPAHPNAAGYDGQFYFAIAHDPFLTNPDTGASLDDSLRYRRILYPLTAWALSFGRAGLLPYAMVIVNVAAASALVGILAAFAWRGGVSPWWTLFVAGFGGVWMPITRDLTEPVQLAFLAGGMVAGSAGLLLLSSLAKETSAVVLVTELVRALRNRIWSRAAALAAASAAVVAWTAFVRYFVTGPRESSTLGQFLRPPGAPLLVLVGTIGEPARFILVGGGLAICLVVLGRLIAVRTGAAVAAAVYAAVELGAGAESWHDPVDIYRQMAGAVVLVFISWTQSRDRPGAVALWLAVGTGVFSALLLAAGKLPR